MDHIQVIYPYLLGTTWVFDDQRTSLKEEAFVFGMTDIISRLVEELGIPEATSGFALHFSDRPFADAVVVMEAGQPYAGGSWYSGNVCGEPMTGWLCPALFRYYRERPARLYVKAEPLPAGVNPIWEVGDAKWVQFMAP